MRQVSTFNSFAVIKIIVLTSISALVLVSCGPKKPETDNQKMSYSLGVQVGETLKRQKLQIDEKYFIQGIKEIQSGKETSLTRQDIQTALAKVHQVTIQNQMVNGKIAEQNQIESDKYMEANAKRHGVNKTPSGLQYEVLRQGKGGTPTDEDYVYINFEAKLMTGEKFDSSKDRGPEASRFQVKHLVPGWSEALKLMNIGAKFKVVIPPALAYKEAGSPPLVPANAVIVLEMELVKFEKPPAPPVHTAPKK